MKNIRIIGFKLYAYNVIFSHAHPRTKTIASLINCVIDDALLKRCQTSIKRCFSSSTSWIC